MKRKVLVVDDTGMTLRSAKALLEDTYEVFLAVSGELALSSVTKNKPDIILLDYDMPKMDGATTFDEIRKLPEGKNVPIVFLTGTDDDDTINALMSKNPAGFILKPSSKEKLFEVIEGAFED